MDAFAKGLAAPRAIKHNTVSTSAPMRQLYGLPSQSVDVSSSQSVSTLPTMAFEASPPMAVNATPPKAAETSSIARVQNADDRSRHTHSICGRTTAFASQHS